MKIADEKNYFHYFSKVCKATSNRKLNANNPAQIRIYT